MTTLTSARKRYLRSLAHALKPIVTIGKNGVTDGVRAELDNALEISELLKIKFTDFKEEKETLTADLAASSGAALVGMIGHIAILYRTHPEPEKRKIEFPK